MPALSKKELLSFLRTLQGNSYDWPNRYFAWVKPDRTLFMIGTRSGQHDHILKHEWDTFTNSGYSTCVYSISPTTIHMHQLPDGTTGRYDPVETLAEEASKYEYLGSWDDPDLLIDSPNSYGRVLACGRFDLALSHITDGRYAPIDSKEKPTIEEIISNAASQKASAEKCAPKELEPAR